MVSRYLEPLFEKSPAPDCLVLGCTHYPMLAAAIRKVVGPEVHIVDSAATTAEVVKRRLAYKGLAHPQAGRTMAFDIERKCWSDELLRAAELEVDAILMAKTIDGVYTADPKKDKAAVFLPEITCSEALYRRLGVMDATAMALCMDNHITIRVFAMDPLDNLLKVVCGQPVGSVVTG